MVKKNAKIIESKPEKPEPRHVVRELPCKLTEIEMRDHGTVLATVDIDMARLNGEIDAIKAKAKAEIDERKEQIVPLMKQQKELREAIKNGTEIRDVDCELHEDESGTQLIFCRVDPKDLWPEGVDLVTGEFERRALNADELYQRMNPELPGIDRPSRDEAEADDGIVDDDYDPNADSSSSGEATEGAHA